MRSSLVLVLVVHSLLASGCAHARQVGTGMMAVGGGTAVIGGLVATGGCSDTVPGEQEGCQDLDVLEEGSGEAGLTLGIGGLALSLIGLITYMAGGGDK